jgi:hypothetical protein
MLIRFKPTKSMGPKHLEGHTSIGHDIDKMSEPSLIRTLPARRRQGLGGARQQRVMTDRLDDDHVEVTGGGHPSITV